MVDPPNEGPESGKACDRQVVASMASRTIALGQCLAESLQSMQKGNHNFTNDTSAVAEYSPTKRRRIEFDADMTSRIMQAFGEAVVDTNWDAKKYDGKPKAPAALLRGRLQHYNRVGQNWRIVVEDATLTPRIPLDPNRRRRDRTSLWEADATKQQAIPVGGKIQLLVYDDL